MKPSSDKEFERYKNFDFTHAKRVKDTPHLMQLQASLGTKSRITIRVDSDVLAVFKERAEQGGGSYQTLMNNALRQVAQGVTLAEMLDTSVRATVKSALAKKDASVGARRRAA